MCNAYFVFYVGRCDAQWGGECVDFYDFYLISISVLCEIIKKSHQCVAFFLNERIDNYLF